MTQAIEPQRRSAANQLRHLQERQQAHAARGPKGVAAAWYDRARSLAAKQEKQGNEDAWNDLAAALQNWCSRWDQGDAP
ncbi:hypothetical protein ACIOFV_50310 [Streptomyces mirabilis]|uniref:hypothetical protein n=1 Tax=Streptomyces mirabilis TaxID=68239 RepID=UPI00381FD0BA